MPSRTSVPSRFMRCASWLVLSLLVITQGGFLFAGFQGFRGSAVGGVSIDVEGVVAPPRDDARLRLATELRKEIREPAAELTMPVGMRMVSLKALEAACQDALAHNMGRLPEEVRFLAGLQRIQYVLVYPEENDIVLAGPGEGWKVDDLGNVVGITSGRPVLQLDDFLIALRSTEAARNGGITVSIDPTPEGSRRLTQLLSNKRPQGTITPALAAEMKEAFGPQQVTITGVPPTSHFARILTAADYHMKRIAMNIDESPVRTLPSYLEMIRGSSSREIESSTPRWWLACNYEPLATSDDELAWELRGPGVKAMTEDEVVGTDGSRKGKGTTSPKAQKWADLMTKEYDALSGRDVVFGELRNLMDLCVVGALLQKENLWAKAGLSAPLLTESASELKTEIWHAPKKIAPEISFLRSKGGVIVSASGGVAVESWAVADRKETVAAVAEVRQQAARKNAKAMWWQ